MSTHDNDPLDEEDSFEPGLVGLYDPDTGRLLTIRFLSEEEKDTLRHIASQITHFNMFKH